MCRKAARRRQFDRLKPEFGEAPVTLYMYVWRLAALVAEKEKPIRADSLEGWHFFGLNRYLLASVLIIRLDYGSEL